MNDCDVIMFLQITEIPEPTPQIMINYPAMIVFAIGIVVVIALCYILRKKRDETYSDAQWLEDV